MSKRGWVWSLTRGVRAGFVGEGRSVVTFAVGDHVIKEGGDYRFRGHVVAAFRKRSGAERFVVENLEGILHIFSAANLRHWPPKPEQKL